MVDFNVVQDEVLARVEALGEVEKFLVFETAVPVGYPLVETGGAPTPYVLVSFGGKSPVAGYQQGITGTRDDLKLTSVAVECVAASPRTARQVANIVRDELTGYAPDSWGELVERLSGDYQVRVPDYDLWPVRFAAGIVFNTNADT